MSEIHQPAVNDGGRYLRTIGKGLERKGSTVEMIGPKSTRRTVVKGCI